MSETRARVENIVIINLFSFLLVDRLSFIVNFLRLSLRSYLRVHDIIEIMICIQTLVHVLISIQFQEFSTSESLQFYDFLITLFNLSYSVDILIIYIVYLLSCFSLYCFRYQTLILRVLYQDSLCFDHFCVDNIMITSEY